MRKIIIFFAAFAIASGTVTAQQKRTGKKPNWGIRTGINLSTLNMDASDLNSPGWKSGFVFGPFFRIRAGENFVIQPEFLYSSMGGKNMHSINGEAVTRLNYFSIPVLAKFGFCKDWAVVAGPQIDFLINAKQVSNEIENDLNGYSEKSFNLTGGIEFWPTNGLGLAARYIHGFTDISPASSNSSLKNQGVQITLAVRL